jgi:hypothetical protein
MTTYRPLRHMVVLGLIVPLPYPKKDIIPVLKSYQINPSVIPCGLNLQQTRPDVIRKSLYGKKKFVRFAGERKINKQPYTS